MADRWQISRRSFLATTVAPAFVSSRLRGAGTQVSSGLAQTTALPSMKDAYRGAFLIGTALDFRRPDEFNDAELGIIRSQFNTITPENSMKPGPVHPQEDQWNWTQADALVAFCAQHDITVMGHTLLWHSQTNPWFFENATRDVGLRRMRDHILTLVGRYKGKIKGWDVVNEAINDGGDEKTAATENLRNAPWLKTVGPDYLLQAFRFAREADPDVALHYNDYNIESGFKHQSSLVLLKRLISEGAPITTVGIQGHWSVARITDQKLEEIERAIQNYKALGLKVAITELDLTMAGEGGGQLGGGRGRGNAAPPTPDMLQAQADAYAKLFAVFLRHTDVIDRVTFWGLNDARSWRAGQNPLVFDRDNRAKPALQAIVNAAARRG
jgi:GH35 family endo-1,4-beta-xylanase